MRDCTIRIAKTKALISFAVTAKLICIFVFAYAKKPVFSWRGSFDCGTSLAVHLSFVCAVINFKQNIILVLKLLQLSLSDEVYKLNKFVEYHFQIDDGLGLRGVNGYSCWLTTIKLFIRLS